MSQAPTDTEYTLFSDYILENYIENNVFPPLIWADTPNTNLRTTNGAEN